MRMNLTPAVMNIMIINVLVYLACYAFPQLDVVLTGYYFESVNFEYWQIVTHMFMHSAEDFTHIFFNMYGLYLFGTALENYWGTKRFVIYYMTCGIGAFFLHMGVNFLEVRQLAGQLTFNQYKDVLEHGISILGTNEHYVNTTMNHLNSAINTGVVGASGAVFGVLLGFGMLFPNTELMLLLPPIPIKAKYFVLIYGAIEFFMAMGQYPKDNVAHYAHLGGMLFGFLLLKYWQKKGRAW
jgi:membrane associated rhomboid family serine protease